VGLDGWRWLVKYTIVVEEQTFEIEVTTEGHVWVNQEPIDVDLEGVDGLPLYSLLLDHQSYETHLEQAEEGECLVAVSGRPYRASIQNQGQLSAQAAPGCQLKGPAEVKAPLPGLLVEVRVEEDEVVEEGTVVAVLESMKMHLELRASRAGRVVALHGTAGQEIGQGDIVAIIERGKDNRGSIPLTSA
jgi:biotin carboxyl carrier protein